MTRSADPLADVTLAVLAGGAGSRMGRPKAWLEIGNTPILRHVLRRLNWPGPKLLVTAPGLEKPPAAELFDHEVADPAAGEGPMRGVLTALENVHTPKLVVIPVDMPCLDRQAPSWLVERLRERPESWCALTRRYSDDGTSQIEPFPLAFRDAAIETVRRRYTSGQRSVRGLSMEPGALVLDAPPQWPADVWTNLNRPEDAERYAASLERATKS